MELQVLVHGINVVEDVLADPGDHAHHVGVLKFPLSVDRKYKIERPHIYTFTRHVRCQSGRKDTTTEEPVLFHLHGVRFAGGRLAVGKYRPVVAFQNICAH